VENYEFIWLERKFSSRIGCILGHGCAEIKWNIGKKRENVTGFENAITFFKITTECSEN
jgi:hypothetical protein